MSEELMDGYEAACKARDEGVEVYHKNSNQTAYWDKGEGALAWDEHTIVCWADLREHCWRVVEELDEPEPPEGCELWPVVPNNGFYYVVWPDEKYWPIYHTEHSIRFRGWGYVLDGELTISAIPIAYTDGDRLVGNKNDYQDNVIRSDYAVMAKEEGK